MVVGADIESSARGSTESRQAPVGQFGERLTGAAIRIDGEFENRDCLEIDCVVLRLGRWNHPD